MKYTQKSFQVPVQPTGITQDEWDSIFRKKKPNSLRGSSFACEHANEVPAQCDCESDCYCATNTCAPRDVEKPKSVAEYMENTKDEDAFEQWFKVIGWNGISIPTRMGLARNAFIAGRRSVK